MGDIIVGKTNTGNKVHMADSDLGAHRVLGHVDTITTVLGRGPGGGREELFDVLMGANVGVSRLCARCFPAQIRVGYSGHRKQANS